MALTGNGDLNLCVTADEPTVAPVRLSPLTPSEIRVGTALPRVLEDPTPTSRGFSKQLGPSHHPSRGPHVSLCVRQPSVLTPRSQVTVLTAWGEQSFSVVPSAACWLPSVPPEAPALYAPARAQP